MESSISQQYQLARSDIEPCCQRICFYYSHRLMQNISHNTWVFSAWAFCCHLWALHCAWHSPERNCGDKFLWPGEILGEESGEELGEVLDEISWAFFVLNVLCRTTHQNFSQNSSQFITPCLVTAPVTEISKFHLCEVLSGLGYPTCMNFTTFRASRRSCQRWSEN